VEIPTGAFPWASPVWGRKFSPNITCGPFYFMEIFALYLLSFYLAGYGLVSKRQPPTRQEYNSRAIVRRAC
jgi:hypothetical protein